MAKKRNTRKLRPQEYPDAEDFEYGRDRPEEEPQHAERIERPVVHVSGGPSQYKPGDVVTCPNKASFSDAGSVTGTVVDAVGKDITVLDTMNVLHRCKDGEVYPAQ